LKQNRYQYIAQSTDPSLSIRRLPTMIEINIDRIRALINLNSRNIGANPVLAICLYRGLDWFMNNPDIQICSNFKKKFDIIASSIDDDLVDSMKGFLRGFELDLPTGHRHNIPIDQKVHSNLVTLSKELGLLISDLAVLSIMHTLSTQTECIDGHREKMEGHINDFLAKVKIRNRGISALMKEFEL